MTYSPLSREDMIRVIEGKGAAGRVPVMIHFWTVMNNFSEEKRPIVEKILSKYPQDAQIIPIYMPDVYQAPKNEPSYRWSYKDDPNPGRALDHSGFIEDWDEELSLFLQDFPSADSPCLFGAPIPEDGRYRLGTFWFFFFERLWSIRSMEEALMDFYENPRAIHAVFRKLCDFYKRMLVRAREEMHLDGIFTSDDLGTQNSTFFSPHIFDEFFAPYYQEIVDTAHQLGMHFWLHTCGNVESLIPRFIDLGIDVLHPIQKYTMDEQKIARRFGDKITIWAGFDVQKIIPYGTAEDVRREARYLTDTYARPDGRFILTLGNGTTGDTPLESLEALFDEAFSYGTEKISQMKGETWKNPI